LTGTEWGPSRFYRGASMRPVFRPGDWLVVEPVGPADLRRGDVIVYWSSPDHHGPGEPEFAEFVSPAGHHAAAFVPKEESGPQLCVHRVFRVRTDGWLTRGDNNTQPDKQAVTADRLVGRVVGLERRGRRRPVRGGRRGSFLSSRMRLRKQAVQAVFAAGRFVLRPLYRMIAGSRMVKRIWKPRLTVVRFRSPLGPFVKYIHRGRTVAVWWPDCGCFICRRPYNMVIMPRDLH
jgi:signal peptidase I